MILLIFDFIVILAWASPFNLFDRFWFSIDIGAMSLILQFQQLLFIECDLFYM